MLTGLITIETKDKFIEQPMNTITKGFADLLRLVLMTNDSDRVALVGSNYCPGFSPVVSNNNFNFRDLISFDDSTIGYDKGFDQVFSNNVMLSPVCNGNSLFDVIQAYGYSEDEYMNITKQFRNKSGSSYTIRRVFLNIGLFSDSAANNHADSHYGRYSNGDLVIACENTNFVVNDNEEVKITFKLKPLSVNRTFKGFLRALLSLPYNVQNSLDTYMTVVNSSGTVTQYDYGRGVVFASSFLPKTSTTSYYYKTYNTVSSKQVGIGSSNAEDPNIDYKLLSEIPTSSYTTSVSSYSTESIKVAEQNIIRFTIKKTFFNSSASAFTVGEVAVFLSSYMFHRVTLSTPVTVPVGEGVEISFNFDCYVGGEYVIQSTACAGSGTVESPYLVTSLANLYWVSQNSSTWGSSFLQKKDIDASDTNKWIFGKDKGCGFPSIGNASINFTGTYDGGGHAISGLYFSGKYKDLSVDMTTKSCTGLFSHIRSGVIKNLTISNSINEHTGKLLGFFNDVNLGASFSNCHSINNTAYPSYFAYNVGSISGRCESDLKQYFTGCTSENFVVKLSYGDYYASLIIGGICGAIAYAADFVSCINKSISIENSFGVPVSSVKVAGILGDNNGSAVSFTSCVNLADINFNCGFLSGIANTSIGTDIYTKCVNKGNLTNSYESGFVAGISSSGSYSATLNYCYNSGSIKGHWYAGGLFSSSDACYVFNSINTGDVTSLSSSYTYNYPFVYKVKSFSTTCGYNLNTGKLLKPDADIADDSGTYIRGFSSTAVSGTITNYFDKELTQQLTGAAATGLTTANAKIQASYANWNFTSVWGLDSGINNGYPYLLDLKEYFPQ